MRVRHKLLIAAGAGATAVALVAGLTGAAYAATLFSDDFNDGDSSGWSKSGGTWSVVTDGSGALEQTDSGSERARQFAGDTGWTDYQVQARVKPLSYNGSGRTAWHCSTAGGRSCRRSTAAP
jgi:pectate lyase